MVTGEGSPVAGNSDDGLVEVRQDDLSLMLEKFVLQGPRMKPAGDVKRPRTAENRMCTDRLSSAESLD
jgi:hypothetical protein